MTYSSDSAYAAEAGAARAPEKSYSEKHAVAITEDDVPRISPLLLNIFHIGALIAVFAAALEAVIPASFFTQAVEPWGVSVSSLWMLASYLIGYVSFVLPTLRISDVFGRTVTFWFGIALFAVFTGVSGNASSALQFAVLRAFQGVGAAIIASVSVQVVAAQTSERSRPLFVGALAAAQLFGVGAAHIIGGKLAVQDHFRWAIYLAAPLIAAPAVLCTPALIRLDQQSCSRQQQRDSLVSRLLRYDYIGTLLLLGAAIMLTTGLTFGGNEHGWSSVTTLCLIIFGAVSAVLFLLWEKFGASHPIFNTLWLRERNLQISMVSVLLIAMTFFANAVYVPIMYLTARTKTTDIAGRMSAPYWGASLGAALLAGLAIRARPGLARPLIWTGLVLGAVFAGLFYTIELKPDSLVRERAFYAVAGVGVGLAYPAVLYMAQISVPREESGPAAAVAHFLSIVGGMLGLILYQACLKSRLIINLTPIFAQSTFLSSFHISTMDVAGLEMSGETMLNYEPKLADEIGNKMMDSLHTTYIITVPLLGTALLASLLYKHHTS
ncbi:hypothetical protein LPJ61_002882 [Coemansia biformis]|uniref:Major facilitator superfamily (MFS) profile domain-containing protein n=1 Tax=Coemansia biformis TaxID=1286918 RepID=A0A9W7YDY0_9FUNG|nr:hypothetical protein LPJ61_002882 [Coemansia biformis]